jgi:hypothetical protein
LVTKMSILEKENQDRGKLQVFHEGEDLSPQEVECILPLGSVFGGERGVGLQEVGLRLSLLSEESVRPE